MIPLVLLGYVAFVASSLVLGTRLLLLARRTRQLPELCVGTSVLLGGVVGYLCWFLVSILFLTSGSPVLGHALIVVGLGSSVLGCIASGLGSALIFRPGRRWPFVYVGAIAAVMLFGWVATLRAAPDSSGDGFWVAVVPAALIYAWGGVEALLLARLLHKRARLGMTDPAIVSRAAQWGAASVATVMMIAIPFAARLAYGSVVPAWCFGLTAGCGLLAALAIWLGFFPPAAYRARVARRYAS